MSNIINEIRNRFALGTNSGAYLLESVGYDFRAWVSRSGHTYGVFFEYDGPPVSENFSGAVLCDDLLQVENEGYIRVLKLSASNRNLRNEFALICEDFVSPGVNGEKRKQVKRDPVAWWKRWRDLLGNAQSSKLVYDIVAELSAVLKLCEENKNPYWSAARLNSHDIELTNAAYEVKSTLKKGVTQVHISSQFQLSSEKPLYLIFTRLEKSEHGISVDDMLGKISLYQPEMIPEYNDYLERIGLRLGNHMRMEKYVVLERRKFFINDEFPKITEKIFKSEKIPKNIVHIEYDVSLEGVQFENWK